MRVLMTCGCRLFTGRHLIILIIIWLPAGDPSSGASDNDVRDARDLQVL